MIKLTCPVCGKKLFRDKDVNKNVTDFFTCTNEACPMCDQTIHASLWFMAIRYKEVKDNA